MPQKTKNNGFSLFETLIALAIITIIYMMVLFGGNSTVAAVKTATHSVMQAMYLARVHAIQNNVKVVFCIKDGDDCGSATNDWTKNWLIFADVNSNKNYDINEEILLDETIETENVSITFGTNVTNIIFKPSGNIVGAINNTFDICMQPNQGVGRGVTFYRDGRFYINQDGYDCN